jgi:hypothetical protein
MTGGESGVRNRGLLVGLWMVGVVATTSACNADAGSRQPPAGSTQVSATADARQELSAADRDRALAAAHLQANQLAVGRDSRTVSGWPSGISAVTAAVRPGTVTDSNTGHTCESGAVIDVRLTGAFDTGTTGTPDSQDNTVREVDLSVDGATGLTCLISVRTTPVPRSDSETLIFSR